MLKINQILEINREVLEEEDEYDGGRLEYQLYLKRRKSVEYAVYRKLKMK